MNLLIVGAPGSGKGTMSNMIIDKYSVVHVSTGDMLRAAVKNQTEVGLRAKQYMDKGTLVPDEIIHDVIAEWLAHNDPSKGFLFDGYPRTVNQAIELTNILSSLGLKLDAVLKLDISDDVLVKRITGRRTCLNCGSIYNIYNKPPKTENICDKCGSTLTQRNDDNSISLEKRLNEYYSNTEPVIEYYEKMGIVKRFDVDRNINEIFNDIKSVLEELR